MLNNSLYTIRSVDQLNNDSGTQPFKFFVTFNPNHKIFEGHFPGNPVVPGVCQVMMILEALETKLQKPLRLTESDQVKFLSMIDPRVVPEIELNIQIREQSDNHLVVYATTTNRQTVFIKFKGKFSIIT